MSEGGSTYNIRAVLRSTLLSAVLVCVIDQLTKWAMLSVVNIDARDAIVVAPFFKLVMVWNYGISFGMLSRPDSYVPWFLIAVALLISAVVFWMALRSTSRYERIAYGVIIGGAIGNVIDRVRFGAVADFFSFHIGPYYYPAFNVADAAIFLGVAGLLLMSFARKKTAE